MRDHDPDHLEVLAAMSGAKPPVGAETATPVRDELDAAAKAAAARPRWMRDVSLLESANNDVDRLVKHNASLRQRLATAEAATRQSDAWYRTALKQAERYDQESRAALADAAALRERVTRAEALLARWVDGGGQTPTEEAATHIDTVEFLKPMAPTEPDGASGNRQGDDK
jgi:small-conductance mechanosensitive channel